MFFCSGCEPLGIANVDNTFSRIYVSMINNRYPTHLKIPIISKRQPVNTGRNVSLSSLPTPDKDLSKMNRLNRPGTKAFMTRLLDAVHFVSVSSVIGATCVVAGYSVYGLLTVRANRREFERANPNWREPDFDPSEMKPGNYVVTNPDFKQYQPKQPESSS
eukprot:g4952.t1